MKLNNSSLQIPCVLYLKVQMEGMKKEHLLLAVSFYISSTGDPVFISLTSVTARKAASFVQTLKALEELLSFPFVAAKSKHYFCTMQTVPFTSWSFFFLKDIVVWQEQQIEVNFYNPKVNLLQSKKKQNKTQRSFFFTGTHFPSQMGKLLIILSYSRKNKSYHVSCLRITGNCFFSTNKKLCISSC